MMFATVRSVQADIRDLDAFERAARRLHARTGHEWFAEQASIAREMRDREAALLASQSWVDRVAFRDKRVGEYRTPPHG
jgi:hypothetical protein